MSDNTGSIAYATFGQIFYLKLKHSVVIYLPQHMWAPENNGCPALTPGPEI